MTSAFEPIPDIGHAEQFVRDGPVPDVVLSVFVVGKA
jgi:hypothetical protein